MKRALPIWLLCLVALAASAAAQSLDLTRARVPGGGGVSAGGQFGLFSTVGQSEAAPRSTGGIFTLDAGFLGATIPSPIPTVFFPQGTVVVLEDSGAQTRTTYAVFEPGQAGEPMLPPIYQLSNNNPALFNVAPAIATNRTLTFTPATNANGTALVTVVVRADGVDVATNTFTIVVTAVNDAPAVALTGNVTVLEDAGAQSVSSFATFAAGPSDESAQTPTYALTTDNPSLFNVLPAIAADGSLTFTTATNANGSATVTVITVDGAGTANGGGDRTTNTFTLTMTAVNDAPAVAYVANNVVVLEDSGAQSVSGFATFTAGPTGESAQTPAYTLIADNAALFSAQPAIAANGTLTFTPALNANGAATITVITADNGGTAGGGVDRSTNTFSITVTLVNDPPAVAYAMNNLVVREDAGAQTVSGFATFTAGPADEAAQLPAYNLSANNAALFSVQPALAANGTLTFTPATNANGSVTVTVITADTGGTANNGADRSTNSFTITVTAVNDQPSVSYAMGTVTVLEDAGAQTVSGFATFMAGPLDESAQTAAYTLTADNAALFSVQPAIAANGTLTYTPAVNANGSATVTVVVQDSGGGTGGGVDKATNTFTIALTEVNDAPSVAFDTSNVIAVKDTGAQTATGFVTFTAGPTDESSQTPAYTLSSDNTALFSTQPVIAPNGTLTFTPAAGAEGVATVTVVAHDNGGTANGGSDKATNTFAITVVPFSTAPDSYAVSEDRLLTVIAGAGVLTNDVGVGLGVRLVDAATNGTVTLNANGSFTYLPATNFHGTDTFTYQATNSLVASAPTAVSITVSSVNDAPLVAFATSEVVVLEDAGARSFVGFASFTAGPTNESAQTLVGYSVSNSSNALFSVQPAIDSTGRLTFTPATHANGSATVTVIVQDSGGTGDSGVDKATNTFVITVTPVNDPPTAALAGNVTVLEDAGSQARVGFVTSFVPGPADESGQTPTHHVASDNLLLFSVQPAIASDGTLTFTPTANANGVATVTVITSDGGGTANGGRDRTTNSFLVTVTPVNDAPSVAFSTNLVAVLEDAGAQNFTAFATFTAGPTNESAQTLVAYTVSNSSNSLFSVQPAIVNDGRLTFTPATNANGSVTVTVIVQDNSAVADGGVDKSTNTFTLTVTPVNDAPFVTFAQSTVTVLEDAGAQSVSAYANFSPGPVNESAQTLVGYSVAVNNAALFSTAPAINNAGVLTFTSAPNASGSATVTVVAQDNGGTTAGGVDRSTNTFTISVTAVNDTPVAGSDSYTMSQGDVLTVTAAGVLANDTDVENHALTATKLTDPAHGTIAFNANGTFTYSPDTSFYGVDSFTYRASDASSNSTPASVSLNVLARPVYAPPPGQQRVFSSAALRFSATNAPDSNAIRVADPDSSTLTLTLTVSNGTLGVTVTNGLTFPNGSTNTNTLVLTGLIANLNAALEGLAYVSITNYFGDDALVLVAQDEGGRTNRGNGVFDILVEIPARGASLEVPLNGFNNPGLGRMVTNATAVTLDTNLVEGIIYDPTNNVVRVQPVGGQDGSTNRSTVTVLARFSDGTTELITVPVIIYQPLLTATTNSGNYDTTFSTPLFNPQTSLYEQKVTVGNNTPFSFTALRITATNLPATVTLQNATLTNGGLPYIEHNLTVPAGGSVTLKLEYFSSDLAPFTPGLRLELLNQQRVFTAPAVTVMTAAALRTGYSPDGVPKFYMQFPTQAGRLYYVQYLDAIGSAWRTSPVTVTGTGFVVQFIDDGPPNTDTAPGRARFYRILTPP